MTETTAINEDVPNGVIVGVLIVFPKEIGAKREKDTFSKKKP